MGAKYLGKQTGLITTKELSDLTKATMGEILHSGDISWLKFTYDGKYVFIADRNIKHSISINELKSIGLFKGKDVLINGLKYKCRLITGRQTPTSSPISTREWDELIVGLVPSNSISHWENAYTLCGDIESSRYIGRGYASVEWSYTGVGISEKKPEYGWRPVLDIYDNNFPTFSVSDTDLGDKISPFIFEYEVTGGQQFKLIEKLDGIKVRELLNQESGTSYNVDELLGNWDSLSMGKHTITIEVSYNDLPMLSNSLVITFDKAKAPITTIPTTSSLKQAIAHSKEIEKEIDYQLFRLESTLDDKGVELLPSDRGKLSSLINKIKDFKVLIGSKSRDSVELYRDNNTHELTENIDSYILVSTSNMLELNGSIRIKLKHKSLGGGTFFKVEVVRGEDIVYTKSQIGNNSSYVEYIFDVDNVKKGDIVKFYGNKTQYASYKCYILDCCVSCDYVISD